jgi:predicted MFS family arabinose efflux permease
MNILFTLPASRWLERRSLGPAVTRAAMMQRLGFLILAPLPLLLPPAWQIWVVLTLIFLIAIPGTALAVGFNALLATAVPVESRGMVVGRRNAFLSAAILISFLFSGWLLDQMPFEWGYVIVFGMGAVGAILSTYHMAQIKVDSIPQFKGRPLKDWAQPGRTLGFGGGMPHRLSLGMRLGLRRRQSVPGSMSSISPQYRGVMLAYFAFHFSQFLPVALFPIFWVRVLGVSDGVIGQINSLFYLTMLIFSPFLERMTRRFGNHRLTIVGAVLLAEYPLLTAFGENVGLIILANCLGGAVWAILSGALANRLLEVIPDDKRPSHLALYNVTLNLAVLSSTLLGPLLGDWIGLREALLASAALRVASGLMLARWG